MTIALAIPNDARRPARHPQQRPGRREQPDERHEPQREVADREPRDERPDGRRGGERAQRDLLLLGAAVEDAIDEHRPADDRGRERVAGQEGHEGRRRERQALEQARIDERVRPAEAADDREDRRDDGEGRQRGAREQRVEPADVGAAEERHGDQPTAERDRPDDRADDVDAAAPSRRLPAGRRRPGDEQGADPDRDVDVEDPPPRRREQGVERAARRGPDRLERALDVQPAEDRRPDERPGRHPEEGERADDAERPRPGVALEQVRCRRGGDRDEDAAAQPLDDPAGDQLVDRLGPAGQQRADREQGERDQEQAARAPDVGQAARQRHCDDVGEQVAVHDP